VLGRVDDAIPRGAFLVSAEEVEDALRAMPGVADAAVVGARDGVEGHVPHSFLVAAPLAAGGAAAAGAGAGGGRRQSGAAGRDDGRRARGGGGGRCRPKRARGGSRGSSACRPRRRARSCGGTSGRSCRCDHGGQRSRSGRARRPRVGGTMRLMGLQYVWGLLALDGGGGGGEEREEADGNEAGGGQTGRGREAGKHQRVCVAFASNSLRCTPARRRRGVCDA